MGRSKACWALGEQGLEQAESQQLSSSLLGLGIELPQYAAELSFKVVCVLVATVPGPTQQAFRCAIVRGVHSDNVPFIPLLA